MRSSILHAPLLLLVWQTAPVGVQPDSAGRYRFSVGYGAGQYESRTLNCAGDVVSASPVEFQTYGAQIDAWATPEFRVSGFGGMLAMDAGKYDGPYGGLVIAAEGQSIGVGAGPVVVSGVDGFVAPSVYLRFGNIDEVHFRTETFPPSATFGSTGWLRAGLGYNQGHLRRPSAFFGFNMGPYSDESHVGGAFGELLVPVTGNFDLTFGGSWRPSAQYADWGLGAGMRIRAGR